MSADDKAAAAWDDYIDQQQQEKIEELERQLNAANAKIKRLVEAGDRMELYAAPHDSDKWNEAKEAKP